MSPLARLSLASLLCSCHPSTPTTPTNTSTPTVSVAVPLADLRGAVDNGLRKRSASWLHRFLKRRVRVEASVDGVKDFVFYAPEGDPSNRRATPTEFVKIRPTPGDATIVRRSDAFEISFVGMSVIPEDTIFDNSNELLLYSLKTCPDAIHDTADDGAKVAAARRSNNGNNNHNEDSDTDDLHSELTNVDAPIAPTSGFSLSPDDIPFIHYDPVVDGHDVGSVPNSFVPVPASKALFYQHRGECTRQEPANGLASVPLRFNVLEIDHVSDGQARAVGSVGELGKMVKSTGIPYLQPLSMAVSAASALGKEGLKNYSKPDHVMSKDLVFMLAEPEDDDNASTSGSSTSGSSSRVETYGNFLRVSCVCFLFFLTYGAWPCIHLACNDDDDELSWDELSYIFLDDTDNVCVCALSTCCAVVYGALCRDYSTDIISS